MPRSTAYWGCVFLKFSVVQLIISIASQAQVFILLFVCKRLCRSSEKSREYRKQKKTQVWGLENAPFPPLLAASPLARHSKWIARSQDIARVSIFNLTVSIWGERHFRFACCLARLKNSEIITCRTDLMYISRELWSQGLLLLLLILSIFFI